MSVLILITSLLVFLFILVQGILDVLWVHVLKVLEVWIFVDRYHDLAHNVVILVLSRQDDLELWMLTDVEDELSWDIRMVVDSKWESLRVTNRDSTEVELCLFDLNIWDLCTGSHRHFECSTTSDMDGDLGREVSLHV